jgi:hypothetical protein
MKPSRKLHRGSFMSRVSGGGHPSDGAVKGQGGQGKGAVESDHDLVHPVPPGADPDSGPR